MNYNRIILIGRLTRDPELRTTPDGVPLVRCSVAVNRRRGNEDVADFFDFVAFRQQADYLANYATKGRLVLVEGSLQTRSYTDREGIRRKAYEIVVQSVRLLDRSRETEGEPTPSRPTAPAAAPATAPNSFGEEEFADLPDELIAEGGFDDVEGDPFAV